MKKSILSTFGLILILSVNAQTAKELIGKWKLTSWKMNGKFMNLDSVFKTNEIFQVFEEGNKFESIVGAKVTKGIWDLSSDNKMLSIEAGGVKADFTIDTFNEKNRIITSADLGTLVYVKL